MMLKIQLSIKINMLKYIKIIEKKRNFKLPQYFSNSFHYPLT